MFYPNIINQRKDIYQWLKEEETARNWAHKKAICFSIWSMEHYLQQITTTKQIRLHNNHHVDKLKAYGTHG